jgi:hypothetical protein
MAGRAVREENTMRDGTNEDVTSGKGRITSENGSSESLEDKEGINYRLRIEPEESGITKQRKRIAKANKRMKTGTTQEHL